MWLLAGVFGCTEDTRTFTGLVQDIWGHPVPEATVVIEGVVERYYSDSEGAFSVEVPAKQLTLHPEVIPEAGADATLAGPLGIRVLVGRDGFIKSTAFANDVSGEDAFEKLKFELYPEPENPGFYAVGRTSYIELGRQRIQMVGTSLAHLSGVQDIPSEEIAAGKLELVFTTRLRPSEIAQMNLHLSRLEFVNKAKVKGVFGPEDDTVNLWVAKDDVPFDLVNFDTREDYLVTTRNPLSPGVYAFAAHDMLHEEDERVLYALPKEQVVAFPFEVR